MPEKLFRQSVKFSIEENIFQIISKFIEKFAIKGFLALELVSGYFLHQDFWPEIKVAEIGFKSKAFRVDR